MRDIINRESIFPHPFTRDESVDTLGEAGSIAWSGAHNVNRPLLLLTQTFVHKVLDDVR